MNKYIKALSVVGLAVLLMGQTRFPPQGGGVTVAGNNTWTGTQTFDDEAFLVCDDGTGTKCLEFEASGISAATTRTLTVQNANYTLAGLNFSGQTFTTLSNISGPSARFDFASGAAPTLTFGTNVDALFVDTTGTPDYFLLGLDTTARAFHIAEYNDHTFDFNNCSAGTGAQTNPTLCIHSSDQATNEWAEINVDTAGGASLKSAQELTLQSAQIGTAGGVALTESSATAVFELSVAQGAHTGGIVNWTVVADDGTDFQALTGSTQFQAINKAGTETCTVATTGGTDEASSSGTLTNTVTCTVGLTDVVQIAFNAASSLTQTTLTAYYTVNLNGPGVVTPQ